MKALQLFLAAMLVSVSMMGMRSCWQDDRRANPHEAHNKQEGRLIIDNLTVLTAWPLRQGPDGWYEFEITVERMATENRRAMFCRSRELIVAGDIIELEDRDGRGHYDAYIMRRASDKKVEP